MKWTSLNDLREKYLSFFESKGHLRLPSFSLVPNNDKSLLLITLYYKNKRINLFFLLFYISLQLILCIRLFFIT